MVTLPEGGTTQQTLAVIERIEAHYAAEKDVASTFAAGARLGLPLKGIGIFEMVRIVVA